MKRVNGEGSVYQRKDGRIVAEFKWVDEAGALRRKSVYCKTKAEAHAARKDMAARHDAGEPVVDSALTVSQVAQLWLDVTAPSRNLKASTHALYRGTARRYIDRAEKAERYRVGPVKVSALRASHVERWLLSLREQGLSGATRRSAYNLLSNALDVAVRDGLVRANVAAKIPRPTPDTTEAHYLPAGDVKRLIAHLSEHRLGPIVILIAHTGLRIGEALALRWDDIDLEAGKLRVTGTLSRSDRQWLRTSPKSKRSNRNVELVQIVVEALRARRREQLEERLAMGEHWQDVMGLVFTTPHGTPIDHSNAIKAYKKEMTSLKLEGGFHTLRHSAATMLLAAGVPMRVASEVLGHSSTAITADIYSHVAESVTREAMSKIGDALA